MPVSSQRRSLVQTKDNPRVAYRQSHGQLPYWLHVHTARTAEHDAQPPESPRKPSPAPERLPVPVIPRPRPAPDGGPLQPRPRPEGPPLPRRRTQRPHSHRKPRRLRRTAWHLGGLHPAPWLAHWPTTSPRACCSPRPVHTDAISRKGVGPHRTTGFHGHRGPCGNAERLRPATRPPQREGERRERRRKQLSQRHTTKAGRALRPPRPCAWNTCPRFRERTS